MAGRRPGPNPYGGHGGQASGAGQGQGQSKMSSSRDMPPRNSADDEDEFNPRFSSLRLSDAGYAPQPGPPSGQMMYGDPNLALGSPYMYPPMGSPHDLRGAAGIGANQQYTPLQSPYLASGMARPSFSYAQSDMQLPPEGMMHQGQIPMPPQAQHMGYEYEYEYAHPHPHARPHPQQMSLQPSMPMPLHQRAHTSPAHVAPPGFAPAYEYAYGSPPMSPNTRTRPVGPGQGQVQGHGHVPQMRSGGPGAGGRGRHARHGSFADDQPSGMYQPSYGRHAGPGAGGGQGGGGGGYQRPTGGSFGHPGTAATPAMSHAHSTWTSPTAQSTAFNTPHHPSAPALDRTASEWSEPTSPVNQHAPAHAPPMPMPSNWRNRQNRMSWSGPAKDHEDGEKERKAYHPQAPAKRSDWVMWVGNVPQNTSHEELWRFFNTTTPDHLPSEPDAPSWKGPSSIFLISRSSCAFVNLSSQSDLDRAVAFFNGRPLRAWDTNCPRMVCRVRLKDDDLKSGVGAQRGTGMHREWVKAQDQLKEQAETSNATTPGVEAGEKVAVTPTSVPPPLDIETADADPAIPMESPDAVSSISATNSIPPSPAVLEHPPEGEGRRRESIVNVVLDPRHKSTNSYASTNSSFLVRHFPRRFFILKSATTAELQDSVKTGTWRTQRHNEPVLDQAFRTAAEVILIFGANKAGEFFGYAKMVEPIDKAKAARRAAMALHSAGSVGSGSGGSGGSSDSVKQLHPSHALGPGATGAGAGASGVEVANAITEAEHAAAAHQRASAIRGVHLDAQKSMPALSSSVPMPTPSERKESDTPPGGMVGDKDRARAGTDPTRPKYLTAHSSTSQVHVSTSPGQMTPANELGSANPLDMLSSAEGAPDRPDLSHRSSSGAQTDSVSSDHFSIVSAPPAFPALAQRPMSSDFSDSDLSGGGSLPLPEPINTQVARNRASGAAASSSAPVDNAGHTIADLQAQIGGSKRPMERGDDGVLRKDTALTGMERAKAEIGLVSAGRERVDALEGRLAASAQLDGPIAPYAQGGEEGQPFPQDPSSQPLDDSKGLAFKIEWVKVGSLPFGRTRMLRNPWNNDREVKVSRDGTEVEPGVGAQLLSAWDPSDPNDPNALPRYVRPAPIPLVSGSLSGYR